MTLIGTENIIEMGKEQRFGGHSSGRMLTVSETARPLHAHPNSVRRWADMGLLPAHRVGLRGDRRFTFEDLISFMAAWKQQQSAELISGVVEYRSHVE